MLELEELLRVLHRDMAAIAEELNIRFVRDLDAAERKRLAASPSASAATAGGGHLLRPQSDADGNLAPASRTPSRTAELELMRHSS